jgi:hypothetical protein
MGYIGNSYLQQSIIPATDFFNGNGVTTTFQLTRPVTSLYAIEVVVNNVQQNPANAFSINALNQLVLTGAPSTGTNNIYVVYNSQVAQTGQPGQGTVGNQQLGSISNINAVGSNMTLQTNGSTVITLDQNQNASFVNTATFNSNILMSGTGYLTLPSGTTAQRITPAAGSIRYNSTIGAPEQYIGGAWQSLLGTSSAYPAVSATAIYNANNSAPSGYYWIKPAGLSQPFQAYCKMDYSSGWMNVARSIPEISTSPVLVGVAGGSGAGDHIGTDFSNPLSVAAGYVSGPTVSNAQATVYCCPGGSYPSTIQTTAAFRTAFPSISQVRVKVWIGTNDGNVVCATVGGMGSVTMITGSSNILGICNNTPNRWSDLNGANQVVEFYGTPQSQTILYTVSTACGGSFNSRILELYIKV